MKVVNLYKEKYDVYIGRKGKGQSGYFGSPIIIGKPCPLCNQIHNDNGSTLRCYTKYARHRVTVDPKFKEAVLALRGKILGCFCKPKPCHGDVLAEICNELNKENTAICEFCNVLHTEGEYRFGKHICNKCINEES